MPKATARSAAAGRVRTGFSKPYVAVYSHTGTTVSFSNGRKLGRGVSVSLDVTTSDANNFYADNVVAESEGGKFSEGTVTATVDGLLAESRKFIQGLPDAGDDGFVGIGDSATAPYVGFGYIVRYESGSVESFVPTVIPKVRFQAVGEDAATQEEDIDWQAEELTANIFRCENENRDWIWVSETEYATEDEAETALKTKLNITTA